MKEKIKELFSQLSDEEKLELVKELSRSVNSTVSISEFANLVQQRYKSSITFSIRKSGPDHEPIISATVNTPFGEFFATGKNQKEAKIKACHKAYEYLQKQ